jgi:hypothetical protein
MTNTDRSLLFRFNGICGRYLLRSASLICLGNAFVAMAHCAGVLARADSACLMESVCPSLESAYFRLLARFARYLQRAGGESIGDSTICELATGTFWQAAKPKCSQNWASSCSTQSRQEWVQGTALRRALLMGFPQAAQNP